MDRILTIGFVMLCLASPTLSAQQKYITDEFEVTMRSGTSTANSIVRLLRSGEAVTVIEEDLASQYSLVETADSKQGYVLTRFLIDQPAARQQLQELRANFSQQQSNLQQQRSEIEQLNQSLRQEQSDNENLKTTLRASEQELAEIRESAANTIAIQAENQNLQNVVAQLQQEKDQLTEENAELRDSTRLDWFVRGGAVSLIAFLIGILITRIRWRKQESWGA